jgi:hypothetical protein
MAIERERSADEPGMGRALLVVVLMIAITAIVCVVIYGVMIAIRPIEQREYRKVSSVGLHAPHSRSAGIPLQSNRS